MLTDRLKATIFGDKAAVKQRAKYVVERLTEPETIRPLLEHNRAYAAYALGQLEPRLFPRSEWWQACGPGGEALVVHARSGLGPAMVAVGDPPALDALLRLHPGPRFTFATFQLEHLPLAQRHFVLSTPTPSLRMSVSPESFRPVEGPALSRSPERSEGAAKGPARRLHGSDLADVNALQLSDGFGFYSAAALNDGIYYGVFADDRLVAMAGTHVAAPSCGLAIVGNVVTHPRYRGRGYATIATSAVTAELLKTCPWVLLTVREANEPAIRLYQRLGYREECRLIESAARRKDMLGLAGLVRRFLTRRRSNGREMVVE